jgi:predicted ATPase/DNA-binding CsgD family transcriptional regulator
MSDTMVSSQIEPLSERERTILRLLSDGLTNREIADRLYLSYETIKWYNKQIYGKLGVANRTHAASLARERGLLDSEDLPPAGVSPRPRHNLPAQITTFIGRETQSSDIADLIRDPSVRLVTLTGPGGVGKTRLALQVANGLFPEFSDGIHLVNLAPIRQPDRVADTIVSTLNPDIPAEMSASEILINYLHGRRMLLLIDNFEQVLEAAPLLVDLLSAAADLKLLVTSREALGVYGETDYPVPPLSLPNIGHLEMVSDYLQYESIELFAQRARSAKPQFRLSERNLEPVSEICLRLDGLPLAIELAAARTERLAPAELLNQLDRSVAALKIGPRGLPDRHRTLESTITWSYDLLTDAEKALFAYLSVFQGGFTLGAAERVAGEHVAIGVEDGLESLVGKNLLVQQNEVVEAYRFRILETIHEYARELLSEGNALDPYRHRHAEYFVGLGERVAPMLRGSEQDYWIGRIEADYENIRSTLAWTLGGGDWQLGLRLVVSMRDYWYHQGPAMDSLRWVELALDIMEQALPALRADVGLCAAHVLNHHGQNDSGNAVATDSLAIYRDLGDLQGIAWALIFRSFTFVGQEKRFDEALSNCDEGIALFRELDDEAGLAQALTIKGELTRFQGELNLAEDAYREALEVSLQSGERRRQSILYGYLGMVEYLIGNIVEAETFMRNGLQLAWALGFTHIVALLLAALAGPLGRRGDPTKAATLLGASASEKAFESAHLEGSAIALEDAVALALEESTSSASDS